jgi:uncharacterized membrane protein YedE/YeeE
VTAAAALARRNGVYLLVGLVFGFALTGSGLSQYGVIHRMLRFEDWDPYLILAASMATAMPLLWLLQRVGWVTPLGGRMQLTYRRIERRQVFGGAVFGVGWAVTGACPGTVSAMIGGGSALALATLLGIFLGIRAFEAVEEAQTERAAAAATASANAEVTPSAEPA